CRSGCARCTSSLRRKTTTTASASAPPRRASAPPPPPRRRSRPTASREGGERDTDDEAVGHPDGGEPECRGASADEAAQDLRRARTGAVRGREGPRAGHPAG